MWIVCCGETREVVDGRVACPRAADALVAADACDDCHLLAWRADERARGPVCAIPIGPAPAFPHRRGSGMLTR